MRGLITCADKMERVLRDDYQHEGSSASSRFPRQRGNNTPGKSQISHSGGIALPIEETLIKEEKASQKGFRSMEELSNRMRD